MIGCAIFFVDLLAYLLVNIQIIETDAHINGDYSANFWLLILLLVMFCITFATLAQAQTRIRRVV
jgi:high-affinity K+ transport system ATPase subunit B